MKTTYPRQHIAEQLSDLRAMRGKIGDLQIAGYGLLSGFPEAPAQVRADLVAAMEAIDRASQIAQETMRTLYAAPTPQIANDDEAEAA